MDNSRRNFLKKFGLGTLSVAALSAPTIVNAISIAEESNTNPLNQKIKVFRYIKNGYTINEKTINGKKSIAYLTKRECEMECLMNSIGHQPGEFNAERSIESIQFYMKNGGFNYEIVDDKITLEEYVKEMQIRPLKDSMVKNSTTNTVTFNLSTYNK